MLEVIKSVAAPDRVVKAVLRSPKGIFETVVIPNLDAGRSTVCVSSQVGCARGCIFCMTATLGLKANLSSQDIIEQWDVAQKITHEHALPPLRNIVLMGMGEPLDNFDAVSDAILTWCDQRRYNVAAKHITLSTVGTHPKAIRKLSTLGVNLAWSVHASDDRLRRTLVPTTKYPMVELRDAFVDVSAARNKKLFVELTLLEGVNDRIEEAEHLAEFFKAAKSRIKINLIAMNPGRQQHRGSERVEAFQTVLRNQGYFCMVRRPRGLDSNAACGQLAVLS